MPSDLRPAPLHALVLRALPWLALVVAFAGAVAESAGFVSKRYDWLAQASAATPEHARTLALADRALAWAPLSERPLYVRAITLRKLPASEETDARLDLVLEELRAVHRNQASVLRLSGERAWSRRDPARAAEYLWRSLWINPAPPTSPANFWRMTMAASEAAGRRADALAAIPRAVAFADRDPLLRPSERLALLNDCARLLEAAGAPKSAMRVRSRANRGGDAPSVPPAAGSPARAEESSDVLPNLSLDRSPRP